MGSEARRRAIEAFVKEKGWYVPSLHEQYIRVGR